jgi:alkylation response protein AidB-like acyl-CoA dehydrogenase
VRRVLADGNKSFRNQAKRLLGYRIEYPIETTWVDTRVVRIYAASSQIMKEIISLSHGRTIQVLVSHSRRDYTAT